MTLHPLADRIVAEPTAAEAKTASGILLPDQAKEKTQVAKVLSIGKDVKEIKVGDQIVYPDYHSDLQRFKQNSKELIIVKEEAVLAIVKG